MTDTHDSRTAIAYIVGVSSTAPINNHDLRRAARPGLGRMQ